MTPSSGRQSTVTLVQAAALVVAAAILPYVSTIDDYFVRDDFGVVQLLARKPLSYIPYWFVSSWMDEIWGFVPDEVRPFPAISYQLTALGGAGSPVLHHVLNILIHAVNGLLVVGVARKAASLSLPAATLAGALFVWLPVHTESVAWITGRVDSMPALFYLASFLAYAWSPASRTDPDRRPASHRLYLLSLALFFVALFTKQNTITMVATLVAFDVIVRRVPIVPLWPFIRPYLPFVAMTVAYLWLRYELFGQVAREGTLDAGRLGEFGALVYRHLRHVITGAPDGWQIVVGLAAAVVFGVWLVSRLRSLVYFGPCWWAIGVAPVAVAGYASPRHVYLAAVGWAVVLGVLFDAAWGGEAGTKHRRAALAAAAVVVLLYAVPLYWSVREWNVMAAVSQKVVHDVQRAAMAAPESSLVIVGPPVRSWEWALPFAVRPPFAQKDLTTRAFIISPRAISCCSPQWFDDTRRALEHWSAGASRESVVALSWHPDTGALSSATSEDTPELPALVRALLDMNNPEDLDRNLRRMLGVLTR